MVGISGDSDLDHVSRTALEAIQPITGLLLDPAPMVVFKNFGDFAIQFGLYYWIDTQLVGYLDAQNEGFTQIKMAFEREGIEMPYPIQTVLLQQ